MSDSATPPAAQAGAGHTRESQQELDRSLASGLAWTGAAKWGAQIITWASTLIVARLLTPNDYGLVGMATLFLGLVEMVTEFGIAMAVVKMRDLTGAQLKQLNAVAMALGVLGFLVTVLAARPLADFFAAADLPLVVVVTGATFIINSTRSVPEALLRRALRFRLLAVIEASRAIATGVVALGLAIMGFGYWALVLSNVAGVAFGALAILRYQRVSFAVPRFAEISDALTLSRDMIVARLAWYAYANADFLVVGKVLGQTVLGAYSLGWTLATIPVNKITALVGKVTSPVFSAVQDHPVEVRRYLLRITEVLALISFPLTVGLGLVAHDFVVVVLDEQWLPAVGALRLLAFYATLRTIQPLLPQVLIITGDSNFAMRLSLISAAVLPAGFYFGSRYGAEGVAWAWIVLDPILTLPALVRLRGRIQLSLRGYFQAILPALAGCGAMAGAVLGAQYLVQSLGPASRLAIPVVVGALVYCGVVLGLFGARVMALKRGIATLTRPARAAGS
jgi:PST family polysaccharide transporter